MKSWGTWVVMETSEFIRSYCTTHCSYTNKCHRCCISHFLVIMAIGFANCFTHTKILNLNCIKLMFMTPQEWPYIKHIRRWFYSEFISLPCKWHGWADICVSPSPTERGMLQENYVNTMAPWITRILTHWPLGDLNEILKNVTFELILMIDGWGISCEIAPIWISLEFTDDQSTLVQVMAWCRQQQAITWANVDPDLCRHMASLGRNELIGVGVKPAG